MNIPRPLGFALASLLLAPAAWAARAVPPPLLPGVRAVLWIGAHPDDEALVAPLLGRLCRDERLRCGLLVLTRGEAGPCAWPQGCGPDLGGLREREMARAAELFGAGLVQWRLADGGGASDPSAAWAAASGGNDALLHSLREAIDGFGPDLVLTFDPRHGSTCHPDHLAAGRLVLAALAGRERPAVLLLETMFETIDGVPARFAPAADAAAGVIGFDAGLAGTSGAPLWDFLVQDAAVHRSQFSPAFVRALARLPRRQRAVYFGSAATLLASDAVRTCP